MAILFDDDELQYLRWVGMHPDAFVANVDRAGQVPHYPMLHRATHAAVSSSKIGSFTTGDYIKVCSLNLDSLETWLERTYGRKATRCEVCM